MHDVHAEIAEKGSPVRLTCPLCGDRDRREVTDHGPASLLDRPAPDAGEAASRRLQDWSAWLDRGFVDVVCPMAYATDVETFTGQVTGASRAAAGRPMWVGIGAYRLPPAQTVEHIRVAREFGAAGIAVFSYDGLGQAGGPVEYLAAVSRAAFQR